MEISTKYGLIGEKLGHSYSPLIHDTIMKYTGLNGGYNLIEIPKERLKNSFLEFKKSSIKGLNVTIPYKMDVIPFLDSVSHEADSIGAVNTILFKNNKAYGYNSDYFGFGEMLKRFDIKINGENALILGTGGASKAVVKYLSDNGINKILFASRNKIGRDIISYSQISSLEDFSIIINCTPSGMYPNVSASPVNADDFKGFKYAVDLIYNPEETLFFKNARNMGLKTAGGLYMLVAQAIKSQEIWNDMKISSDLIEKIYIEVKNQI